MRFKSVIIALIIAFAFSIALTNFLTPAFAQSAIERSFVPKSNLADAIWSRHDPNSTLSVDHSAWDGFLARYVETDGQGVNRVAYGRVSKNDQAGLENYLRALEGVDVTKLNRDEQFAYWLNLYNASTVLVVVKNYPLKSIRDVKNNLVDFQGPFNDAIAKVNGKTLTLNTIESGIVRPVWNDPRLHYAFNCAAVTCPNLSKKAYTGASLNAQLNAAAKTYVNSPRGIAFEDGKIIASKIYFWYEDDFGGSETGILKHINQYANADLKAKLQGVTSIDKYIYDWSLNEAR